MKRFYITTPIYYVNAKPHLGHAYTTIVADALARFNRAMGRETYFLTGTDEHGDKIVEAAEKAGSTPAEYVDRISALFRGLWPELGITNDDFIRTTEPRHKRVVQDVLQRVYDAGDIYLKNYEGLYCYGCEQFLTEKDLDAEGCCPDHKVPPAKISEANYFFRMSKYTDWLRGHIEANPDFIRPVRYRNEVLSLLEMGVLDDLCISRPKSRLSWGIELPFDTDFVCYVWFDALLNYVTALDWPDGEGFKKFWPSVQHLVAKDILKPHAVFWPTMLKAAGLPVYQHLNVHGYWLIKDTKMSKSLGNVIEPLELRDRYGLDPFRYFLLREMAFGRDASFSEQAMVGRYNADLANDLGNLFSRVLSMAGKYFGGVVPPDVDHEPLDDEIIDLVRQGLRNYQQLFEHLQFDRALESLWEGVRGLNKYVDSAQPWALHKAGETARLGTVLYVLLECMRKVALHLSPVMPETSVHMLAQLGAASDASDADLAAEADDWGGLAPGTALAKASNLFPRVEAPVPAAEPEAQPQKKAGKKHTKQSAPAKAEAPAEIQYDDFARLDLRVGTVMVAQRHPDADRLLRLEVDLGEEGGPRQVIAGLAEHYDPADLVGRQVMVVANLAPRKLRGLESHGMVLAAHHGGSLKLVAPPEPVDPGSKVS